MSKKSVEFREIEDDGPDVAELQTAHLVYAHACGGREEDRRPIRICTAQHRSPGEHSAYDFCIGNLIGEGASAVASAATSVLEMTEAASRAFGPGKRGAWAAGGRIVSGRGDGMDPERNSATSTASGASGAGKGGAWVNRRWPWRRRGAKRPLAAQRHVRWDRAKVVRGLLVAGRGDSVGRNSAMQATLSTRLKQ